MITIRDHLKDDKAALAKAARDLPAIYEATSTRVHDGYGWSSETVFIRPNLSRFRPRFVGYLCAPGYYHGAGNGILQTEPGRSPTGHDLHHCYNCTQPVYLSQLHGLLMVVGKRVVKCVVPKGWIYVPMTRGQALVFCSDLAEASKWL